MKETFYLLILRGARCYTIVGELSGVPFFYSHGKRGCVRVP